MRGRPKKNNAVPSRKARTGPLFRLRYVGTHDSRRGPPSPLEAHFATTTLDEAVCVTPTTGTVLRFRTTDGMQLLESGKLGCWQITESDLMTVRRAQCGAPTNLEVN